MAREIGLGGGQAGSEGAVETAARRLDRALHALETRLLRLGEDGEARASAARGSAAFDADRTQLAAELDAARARERALEGIAAEASAALGRAAAEVRAALATAESAEADTANGATDDGSAALPEEPTASGDPADPDDEAGADADLFTPQRSA